VDRPSTFRRQLFFNYQTDASRRLEAHASRSGAEFTVHIVNNDWIQVGEQDRD
jgi:predicted GIY-YIG superfamily endonuclease